MQQVSKQLIKGLPRRIALMLLDCGLIVLCYWLAVMLRFDSGDAYRRVRADHTVVAATGNTALFSREEIAQKLRETEHPAEEG